MWRRSRKPAGTATAWWSVSIATAACAKLKGDGRPLIDQQGRAEMLAALACVDYVVIFDDASVTGLMERLLPDVLVKAAQYGVEGVVGHEIVQRNGGRIVLAPMKPGYSTSALVAKLLKRAGSRE